MQTEALNIREGMDVLGTDGEKIGNVERVYTGVGAGNSPVTWNADAGSSTMPGGLTAEQVPASATGSGGLGNAGSVGGTFNSEAGGVAPYRTAGTATMGSSDSWFITRQGGVLGIGARELYIPFDAVAGVSGNEVTVSCVRDQCADLFGEKPTWLEKDGSA